MSVVKPHAPSAAWGGLFAIAAVACFGVLDTSTQHVGAWVPAIMVLWVRFAIQAIGTTLIVLPMRGPQAWRTRHIGLQAARGATLLITSALAFFSLRYIPVGEFTAIIMVTPLAMTLVAATVLRERVSALRWALVAGGFAGVCLIIRPGAEMFRWASLLPLLLVAFNVAFQALTSRLARVDDPLTTHLHTGWWCLLGLSVLLPWGWTWPLDASTWLTLALLGLAATVGHLLLIFAYRHAPASHVTPLLYAQIGFAMLGGWLVFSHVPDRWAIGGIMLIAACGAASAWLGTREIRVAALTRSL